ncbi:MAG: hypothetical protein SFY56_06255 [Bacteroidota bacterium]|nr:hypothetical protein [Bacteroidota bacterium]
MKKITLLAVAALAISFASCKKERVCECVSSSDAPGSVSSTEKVTYKKAKKGICDETSSSSIMTAPVAGVYTSKTECTLK